MPNDLFHSVGERAKSIVAIASVLSLLLTGAWYAFRLESRVQTLEAQLQAVALRPGASVAGDSKQVVDPIAQACADLAKQHAALYAATKFVEGSGCKA